MLEATKINMGLDLDKSDWETFRFDQIAAMISERVDPSETDADIYVGLEHLDSESLHIKRFGTPADVKGTKLKVYPGDVIFGRRRAYQRKAAIAEFEGICSAHAMVLRAKAEVIDPKLFPFFLHSDTFMHRAIDISVGSLSPTINWKTLRKQEFLLPPKDQQARIAELLWAGDAVVENDTLSLESLNKLKKAIFKNALYKINKDDSGDFGNLSPKWEVKRVGDLISNLQYGISEKLSEHGEIPILRMNNLENGKLKLDDLKFFSPQNGFLDNHLLEKGDLLFNRTNSYELVGKVSLFDKDGIFSFASYLIRIKTLETKLDPRFLNFFFNTGIGIAKIRKYRTPGVSQSNINAQNIRKIKLPSPPLSFQKDLMDKIENIEKKEEQINRKILIGKELTKSLINQIF